MKGTSLGSHCPAPGLGKQGRAHGKQQQIIDQMKSNGCRAAAVKMRPSIAGAKQRLAGNNWFKKTPNQIWPRNVVGIAKNIELRFRLQRSQAVQQIFIFLAAAFSFFSPNVPCARVLLRQFCNKGTGRIIQAVRGQTNNKIGIILFQK